jgi:uncharacterized membrane protein YdjX (TVP38/TMEM64 family)
MLGRRYLTVACGLAAFFLTGFIVVEAFGVPWLSTPPALGREAHAGVADAVLPVPSSLVMLALGALFGVAGGIALALVGRVGATLLAFVLGRRLRGWIGRPAGRWSEQLLHRWGTIAIVLTRPVPIIGETVAVLAGASPMPWRRAAVAATLGSLPEAVLFAWAGAVVGGTTFGAVLWLSLIVIAAAVWAAAHLAGRSRRATAVDHQHAPAEVPIRPSRRGCVAVRLFR